MEVAVQVVEAVEGEGAGTGGKHLVGPLAGGLSLAVARSAAKSTG